MAEIDLQNGLQDLGTIDEKHKYGKLGYTLKGIFRIHVPRSSQYYVRFENGEFVKAFHGPVNVSDDIANSTITVELEKDDKGNYSIKGVPSSEQDAQEQHHTEIYAHPYSHTHQIVDMAWIGIKSLTNGNVLIANGTQFNSMPQSALNSGGGSGWFSQLKVISTVVTTPVNTVTIITESLTILSGGGLILNGELRII